MIAVSKADGHSHADHHISPDSPNLECRPCTLTASCLRTSVWLGVIIAAALLLQCSPAGCHAAQSDPWDDPDGYLRKAALFVADSHGWHWDFNAFTYGRRVKAPLYPFVLSLFAIFPAGFPAVGRPHADRHRHGRRGRPVRYRP